MYIFSEEGFRFSQRGQKGMDLERAGRRLNDVLFPPSRCLCCQKKLPLREGLCEECAAELIPLRFSETLPPENVVSAVSAYSYDKTAKALIHAFKYKGWFDLPLRLLLPRLTEELKKAAFPVEAVVPVPTNLPRLYSRGFDHTYLLAKQLGKALGLPVYRRALRRRWHGRRQVGLGAAERKENAVLIYGRGPFPDGVIGKNILLVDDVTTTGSTASACAAVLLTLGAKGVYLGCLAHTPGVS